MTKLEWYDAPVFPFLAMINGCAFWIIFQRIIDNMKFSLRKEFLFPAFVFLIFFLPYKENIKNVFALPEKYFNPEVQFSSLMNELKISHPELRKYTVIPGCVAMYHGQVSFFVKAFNSQGYSLNIGFLRDNNLKPFSYALTSDENTKWLLQTMYNYKIIATYKDCILYQIISGLEPYPDAILKLTKLKIHTSISWMNAISKERGSNFERELHSNAIHYLESTHNITSEEGNYLKLKLPDERK
jgi:hypothetical protein